MIKGKCLCGEITYTLKSDLLYLYHCHCVECRAFSGSSFATNASIAGKDFEVNDPNGNLKEYKIKSGGRFFCANCGSPVYSYLSGSEKYPLLHCGTIVGFPNKAVDANYWVSEKCPWISIDASLQNFNRGIE